MTVTQHAQYYDSHLKLLLQGNGSHTAGLPHNLNAVKIFQPVMSQLHILLNRAQLNNLRAKLPQTKP